MKAEDRAKRLGGATLIMEMGGVEATVILADARRIEAAITAAEKEAFEAGYKIACRHCLPHDPPTGETLAARGAYDDWRKERDGED